ncbi:MAG: hypothetical protein EAZ23_04525 [Oscillatoriales cyanobacterium]|jgi:hypothetical protein|nr:MAG: hypothetical protein EAZ23_04525 [Oscillatoriales cyanobacterium]
MGKNKALKGVHLIFENILVGAKHFGSKSLILVHKLCAEMLRPCQNEMHPLKVTQLSGRFRDFSQYKSLGTSGL